MAVQPAALEAPRRPGLFVLIAISAIGPIALNIFIPSMPGLRVEFGSDYALTQMTLTLYLVSMAVAQLFIGPLSDRFGRRPIVLAGTAVFVLASLGCAFAASIEQLIIGRIVQAAGGCAGIALSRAIVRDLYERDRAASLLGYVTMAMAVAPMVSPAIGGVLDGLAGWRSSFFLVAAVGALVLALSTASLHETNHARGRSNGVADFFANSGLLLREPAFIGYALNSAFGAGMFFAFLAGAPFIVSEIMHLSPAVYGFYFILVSLGYMLGNFVSGRFSTRVGSNKLLVAGSIVALSGVGLLLIFAALGVQGPVALFLPMMVVALANGLTIPNATAGAVSVKPEIAGAAAGLTGFLQIGFGSIATVIVGLLHDGTRLPTISTMAASAVLSAIALALALRRRP